MSRRVRLLDRDLGRLALPAVGWAERLLYLIVGAMLMIAAFLIIVYAVVNFFQKANEDFILAVIVLINDLLLVLIVLEVLGTVRDYLATGSISLRVFLYVGIISAIRRILAIGAQTTASERLDPTEFRNLMLDLGVNALVVLALAAALYLVGHQFSSLIGRGGDAPDTEVIDHVRHRDMVEQEPSS